MRSTGLRNLPNFQTKLAGWLHYVAERINPPSSELDSQSNFVHLAPIDNADETGTYSKALTWATDQTEVSNIALTGPYGSGKSSIIKSFLKNYRRPFMQISLASFLPEAIDGEGNGTVSRQEIERSILQQMLYGADASRLPFSRFKRIQSPGKGAALASLCIVLGVLACWHLFQKLADIVDGSYFQPFDFSNWFNLASFAAGGLFLWLTAHRFYIASFGVSLKSISLKDIQITPESATEESILNRHLDEIIYFFQSTKYDLVIIEDLDRFDKPDIFVTLREINSLVNANSGVKRTIRFLYALRDNIFLNTDRTKFFEFIIPVIPIINSSNSIDMVLKQGKRLAIDERLDGQFLREVSRYLNDLRLIRNIFNEYAIYVANLETDGEYVLDTNKLLAVLIYKNVFPSDFENLHRGKGSLAQFLDLHDEFIAKGETKLRAEISHLEEQIAIGASQLPADLHELCRIYAMALIEKLPPAVSHVGPDRHNLIALSSLSNPDSIEQIIGAQQLVYQLSQGALHRLDASGFQAEVDPLKTYQQRREEVECKADKFRIAALRAIQDLRMKLSALRLMKFNEILRENANEKEDLFIDFGENAELAKFLVLEGFLDDTYYLYTSLFHSGRLSPNDNKFLRHIRAFANPEPEFQIDNPNEVIAAMRDDDFGQSYVLNVKIVDCLLSEPSKYEIQRAKLFQLIASDFEKSEEFFTSYYARGSSISTLISELVNAWAGFVPLAITNTKNLQHIGHIIASLSTKDLAALSAEHPDASEFISANLSQILALGIAFEASRLKALQIEAGDLSSVEGYPGIAQFLFDESLYQLSISNLDFVLQSLLGIQDHRSLRTQHYTTVLKTENATLINNIESKFTKYLSDILLNLTDNREESIPAILSVINHDELDIKSLRAFLEMQMARIPTLAQAPARLYISLFELEKIEASWENCLAFLSSDTFDPNTLTNYLNINETVTSLSHLAIPDGAQALPLHNFLIENDSLNDDAYAHYIRALPTQFPKFPERISWDKLRLLIEEEKIAFSSENLAFLVEDSATQVLFVLKNIERYLEIESECALDDDFREELLDSDVGDEQKLRIIRAMDWALLADIPARAKKIGPILVRTGVEGDAFGGDAAVAVIVHSQPIEIQIQLLNKLQRNLNDQEVKTVLASLEAPFSDIKPGYGTPRIESTAENRELVRWLEARRFISSWNQGGWLGLDNDIRINLRRK